MNHYDYCAQFVRPVGKILDVGSGRGQFLCEMAKRGFAAYGVEIYPPYIEEAQALANASQVNVFWQNAPAEQLPFADEYFNFVNCTEVSEHVENPQQMCREIWRVIKPGGRCYISFHNRYGYYDYHYHLYFINWLPRSWSERALKFLNKQKQDEAFGRQKLTTMHYYTYRKVARMLKDIGFEMQDVRAEKIKNKFGLLSPVFLSVYFLILRPFYFNSFHLLLSKNR
ncbi:hypothetical protein COU00_02025 [Candidatus Falkowbacteria bacterium CG10_big_fil_rev_8_21_14_0_10_43_11]|uniref:Methyltransferase type 11 domain-containing protein n=1 Tax=Candidatus Falkowbacteria bacterium CG10_big_fil_rev_8_21_14_0_10_43_11 TaxID=1974568 RepID=A0A2M6WM85_9BACT|nr:MAG: hypothetical protein COU00_02025 [Candidatus Falkowbacteria bacterium CG10_big_fil_rev_8_21_14_0_10_43_11]